MKRIIVTEEQYKRLVRQNINEYIVYEDPKDEYDVQPQMGRFLGILDTTLMDRHKTDTYVKKIEKGVVELDSEKYDDYEKETIKSVIDWWVNDTEGKEDSRGEGLSYDSGSEWEYKGEIEPVIPPEELVDKEDEEEKIEVDTEYLSSEGIPKLGSETYGFKEGTDSLSVFRGGINGNWSGSMGRALWFAKIANEYMGRNIVSSQKRSRKMTKNKNVSDHYKNQLNSYAVDLAVSGTKGDQLLKHIMSVFANGKYDYYKGGSWFNKTIDGYRYQIGWKSDSDHYDHIHVGVRKV
jgi:hypothetical protein